MAGIKKVYDVYEIAKLNSKDMLSQDIFRACLKTVYNFISNKYNIRVQYYKTEWNMDQYAK